MGNPVSPKSVRVAIDTLGCKLNQAESESIGRSLAEFGCEIVGAGKEADIYLINTCSVTHVADRKSRHLLRSARRQKEDACVIALGCAVEGQAAGAAGVEGVDLLLDNAAKENIVAILQEKGLIPLGRNKNGGPKPKSRTRSFLKVQSGCDLFCRYCIVPSVRGRERSIPPQTVLGALQGREVEGYREVVLTGTEVGRYSFQGTTLADLIEMILAETSIPRLRISSLQPQEVDPELLGLWRNPRLCRHFHLSLQSGSDSVLARMGRRYTRAEFKKAVDLIRNKVEGCSITTDVIVGFPGETEREFRDSCEFSREVGFARIHVFPFSDRRGTAATALSGQIDSAEKNARSQVMLALAAESQSNFFRNSIGTVLPVLFEQSRGGLSWGLSDNYLKIYLQSQKELTNQIADVTVKDILRDGLTGELATTRGR